jgi:hypothetical protein
MFTANHIDITSITPRLPRSDGPGIDRRADVSLEIAPLPLVPWHPALFADEAIDGEV